MCGTAKVAILIKWGKFYNILKWMEKFVYLKESALLCNRKKLIYTLSILILLMSFSVSNLVTYIFTIFRSRVHFGVWKACGFKTGYLKKSILKPVYVSVILIVVDARNIYLSLRKRYLVFHVNKYEEKCFSVFLVTIVITCVSLMKSLFFKRIYFTL